MNLKKPSISAFPASLIPLPEGRTSPNSHVIDPMGKQYDRELSLQVASNILVSFKNDWTDVI